MRWRKVHVDDVVYQYAIGTGTVVIRDAETRRVLFRPQAHVVKKVSPDVLERGRYKMTSDGMIGPKDVATFIREHAPGKGE